MLSEQEIWQVVDNVRVTRGFVVDVARAIERAALNALPKCKCGQPWVLNTVHRANSPCWRAQEPPGGLGPNSEGDAGVGKEPQR